jgi:hypothetical protein
VLFNICLIPGQISLSPLTKCANILIHVPLFIGQPSNEFSGTSSSPCALVFAFRIPHLLFLVLSWMPTRRGVLMTENLLGELPHFSILI